MQIEAGKADLAQFERNLGEWVRKLLDGIRAQSVAKLALAMPRPNQVLGTARPGLTVAQQTGSTPQQYTCQACGKAMRFRAGLHGGFWGCSGYPGCKNTLPDDEGKPGLRQQRDAGPNRPVSSAHQQVALSPDKSAQSPQMTCTACGRPMKRRNGFNGPFWGCTGYPGCRQTAEISDKGEAP